MPRRGSWVPRGMILFDVELATTPDQRPAFVALIERTMAACRSEPGCTIYRFTADVADPLRFYLCELWEDEAALLAHAGAQPFRDFLAELPAVGSIVSSAARQGDLAPYRFRRPAA